jgi:hypothetical protein
VRVKIDNFPVQTLSFSQTASGAQLGVTFTLGTSPLSFEDVFAPFTQEIDGIGRGITLEIEQTGIDQQVEIYGYTIWFEPLGAVSETRSSTGN